jgi:hypothetical protein
LTWLLDKSPSALRVLLAFVVLVSVVVFSGVESNSPPPPCPMPPSPPRFPVLAPVFTSFSSRITNGVDAWSMSLAARTWTKRAHNANADTKKYSLLASFLVRLIVLYFSTILKGSKLTAEKTLLGYCVRKIGVYREKIEQIREVL